MNKQSAEEHPWHEIAFNQRDPVYLQVVRHFKERIATGRLQAGQVIPSRREIASLLKINPNTAQKAYKEMEDKRLIVTEGNTPSHVTRDKTILHTLRSELIGEAVDHFITTIRPIEMPLAELLEVIQDKYEKDRSMGSVPGEENEHD